jgi:hypothetical protein
VESAIPICHHPPSVDSQNSQSLSTSLALFRSLHSITTAWNIANDHDALFLIMDGGGPFPWAATVDICFHRFPLKKSDRIRFDWKSEIDRKFEMLIWSHENLWWEKWRIGRRAARAAVTSSSDKQRVYRAVKPRASGPWLLCVDHFFAMLCLPRFSKSCGLGSAFQCQCDESLLHPAIIQLHIRRSLEFWQGNFPIIREISI